jgi:hypothetical protein
LYLLLPNAGFGGSEIKIRIAWIVFVFGCIAASTAERMRAIATPVAIYVAAFLTATLIHGYAHNVAGVSGIIGDYTAALERIPEGSTFIRIRFPAEQTRIRYGMDVVALEPLLHADSMVAARRRLLALTDYQPLTDTFPVRLRTDLPPELRMQLWDMEGTGPNTVRSAQELLRNPGARFDYVVLLGDGTPPDTAAGYASVRSQLDAELDFVAADPAGAFVRVYKRRGQPAAAR